VLVEPHFFDTSRSRFFLGNLLQDNDTSLFFGKSNPDQVLNKFGVEEKEEKATASNPNQDVTTALNPNQDATTLYDTIKSRCTECSIILAFLLGLINMSILVANTGRTHTKEARNAISVANTDRTHTEEAKNAISVAMTGRIHTKESRKKIAVANTGKLLPEKKDLWILELRAYKDVHRDCNVQTAHNKPLHSWVHHLKVTINLVSD